MNQCLLVVAASLGYATCVVQQQTKSPVGNHVLGGQLSIFFPACFWTSGPRLAVKCQAWQPTSHDSNIILPFFSFQEESKSKNRFEKNKEEYDEQQVEGREGGRHGGRKG